MLVAEWLESRKMMTQAAYEPYLVKMLADAVFSMLNLQSYVDLLADLHLRRQAVELLKTATDQITCNAELGAQDVVNQAVQERSQQAKRKVKTIGSGFEAVDARSYRRDAAGR